MVTELVNAGQIEVVVKCIESLDEVGHEAAFAQVSLAIAKLARPDVMAKVMTSSPCTMS